MVHDCAQPFCEIVPPHILVRIAEEGDDDERRAALDTLATSAAIRARRGLLDRLVAESVITDEQVAQLFAAPAEPNTVYDMQHGTDDLPGERRRGRDDPESDDDAVNAAFDGADTTYDFYKTVFDRDSLDGRGFALVSSVHFGTNFTNAFWNRSQMVYGDGSSPAIARVLTALDVVAHELTHGVTQFTARLEYVTQSGALNESFSDVFASMVKQYKNGETADGADWLIGEGFFGPNHPGTALRSLKAPGQASDHDDQPAKMSDYIDLPPDNLPGHDNGGVHINSGIPNHAFYLAATAIGGNSWEKVGRVWYQTLTDRLERTSQFEDAANATLEVAEELFGTGAEHDAIGNAWREVEVL